MGNNKIFKLMKLSKSTVSTVIKKAENHNGNTHDAPRAGRTKITDVKRKIILDMIDAEPHLALRDITHKANVGLEKDSINKISGEARFKLKIPRKQLFWSKGQKEKRKEFARQRRNWTRAWKWVVCVDEATIEYDPNPGGRKVRLKVGEELEEKNLKPSSKSGRTNIGVCAAIMHGRKTELILVRKRREEERTSKSDRLGLNAHQYATEIHQPYLIPFIEGINRSPGTIHMAADNASWHHPPSPLHTRRLKSQHHKIITTFPNSTPRYEFALGGGVIPPLHFPSLRFIPLGLRLSGLMDFGFFLLMFPLPTPLLLYLA